MSRSSPVSSGGNEPERLLLERSITRRLWRERIETGKRPEKELWPRIKVLRLRSLERSGIGPVNELFFRLKTRSWSSRDNEAGGNCPRSEEFGRKNRTTRPCMHFTPFHEQ